MPAIKKAFDLLGDDIVDLSTENDALKNKIGSYDEKWLEESKNRMLKQIDEEKRANSISIMSRMKKQMENINLLILTQLIFYKWLILVKINHGKVNLMVSFLIEINYKF